MKKQLFAILLVAALAHPTSVDYNGNPINRSGGITITPQTSSAMLASYTQSINTAGLLDATFGVGGIVNTPLGGAGSANALVVQPDGKLVAVGAINPGVPNFYLVRYNSNGSLDSSFGVGGIVSTPNTSNSYAAVLQPDGKIVAAGNKNGVNQSCLVRYNADGSLDRSFGLAGTGIVTTPGTNSAYSVLLQPDGKIIALGQGGGGIFTLARYISNGSLDLSFGLAGTGIVSTDVVHPAGSQIQAAVLQPDGKIVAIGGGDTFTLVRYNSDGAVDNTFGLAANNNVVTTPNTSNAYGAVLQPDRKIVVVGDYNDGGRSVFCLVRYNSDGSIDTTFGSNGTGIVTTPNTTTALAGVLQPDEKILAAGDSGRVACYLSNGSLDRTFGSDGTGIVTTANLGPTKAIALQSDNKIVIAGQTSGAGDGFSVVRYINPFTLASFIASYGSVGLL